MCPTGKSSKSDRIITSRYQGRRLKNELRRLNVREKHIWRGGYGFGCALKSQGSSRGNLARMPDLRSGCFDDTREESLDCQTGPKMDKCHWMYCHSRGGCHQTDSAVSTLKSPSRFPVKSMAYRLSVQGQILPQKMRAHKGWQTSRRHKSPGS